MSSIVKRTIKGGGGYLATNLIVKALGFVFVLVASRLLGSEAFGLLALALSVQGLVTSFSGLGLPVTVQRFLSGDGESEARLIYGSAGILAVVGGLIGGFGLFLAAPLLAERVFSKPGLMAPLRIVATAVLLAAPHAFGIAVLQAQQEVKKYGLVEGLRAASKVLFVSGMAAWTGTALGAAWAVPASTVVSLALTIVFLRGLDFRPVVARVREQCLRVLRYSLPLVVVGFSYFLAQQADRIMLGMLGSASQVGVYTVVSGLAFATTIVHKSLVTVFMPVASEAYRRNRQDELQESYWVVGKWAAAVNAIGLLVFVGIGPIILQIFGADYVSSEAYTALVILASLYFLGTCVGPTGAVLQMSDGQLLELINTVVFIVVNIGLNVVLIPRFGIIGAAAATFASGLVRNGLQVWEIRTRLGFLAVNGKNFGLLMLTALGLAVGLWLRGESVQQLSMIGVVLLFLGAYVLLTLEQEERELLSRVLQRVSVS